MCKGLQPFMQVFASMICFSCVVTMTKIYSCRVSLTQLAEHCIIYMGSEFELRSSHLFIRVKFLRPFTMVLNWGDEMGVEGRKPLERMC
jgi:hypothetical protein